MEQAAPSRARVAPAKKILELPLADSSARNSNLSLEQGPPENYLCRVDDSKIERMRGRARQMRRAASMTHNPEIHAILTKAADEAEADAAEIEAALNQPPMPLPPQG